MKSNQNSYVERLTFGSSDQMSANSGYFRNGYNRHCWVITLTVIR